MRRGGTRSVRDDEHTLHDHVDDADRRYLADVLSGADPDDRRRALPGMAEAHARIVELARQHRQR